MIFTGLEESKATNFKPIKQKKRKKDGSKWTHGAKLYY